MAHGTQQDSTSSVGLLSDWEPTSSMTEPSGDQPPAYNANSIPLRDVSSDINHTTYPLSDQSVRLCLHQTLPFEIPTYLPSQRYSESEEAQPLLKTFH